MKNTRLDWLVKHLAGKFIVIDGPDGCGKSTVKKRLMGWMEKELIDVIDVREPGGTGYGELIRDVLLHKKPTNGEELDPTAEMLLFMAARMQLMNNVVIPAIDAGKTVLTDRFVSSTLAYQGSGSGVDWQHIINVAQIVIPEAYWPHCTVILDVSSSVARARQAGRDASQDRIESKTQDFHKAVRLGYLKQAAVYPEHVVLVDANEDPDTVFDSVLCALFRFFDPDNNTCD